MHHRPPNRLWLQVDQVDRHRRVEQTPRRGRWYRISDEKGDSETVLGGAFRAQRRALGLRSSPVTVNPSRA